MNVERRKLWGARALAVVAGALSGLSLPNANIAGFAWIAPGLMLLAARGGQPFRTGYIAGVTHYLIALYWLLHIPVTFYPILGWIALAAYLASYPALWVWLSAWVLRCDDAAGSAPARFGAGLGRTIICAAVWVALEMTVSRMFSGFPWNLVGVTQHRLLPLIQVASWTGVYGISFVVVWFSIALHNAVSVALRTPADRSIWLKQLALPIFVVALLYACGLHAISHRPEPDRSIRIAMVQPSIPQTMIWNPDDADERFRQLLKLSRDVLTNKADLLIWPEAAVPSLVRDDPVARRLIGAIARDHNVWIIIGADDFDMRGTNRIYYNSSFLVSPAGELISTYRKRRLVIFGEYVPLVKWMPFIRYLTPISGGFAAGDAPVTFKLGTNGPSTSVLICFEDTFAHYAREHAKEDVEFLVNITNNGWFGESAAHWQHAVNAAFRSIENRLPLVRCSNNGVTCWINDVGALRDPGFDAGKNIYGVGAKVVEMPYSSAPGDTFYKRHGDWFGWLCVVVGAQVLLARITAARRDRRSKSRIMPGAKTA